MNDVRRDHAGCGRAPSHCGSAFRDARDPSRRGRRAALGAVLGLAAGGWLYGPPPALAAEFSAGELQGSFDVTLSHGVAIRTAERDDALIGINSDDGNRNYGRGVFSNTSGVTGEIELDHGNFGAFARFHGLVDFENQNGRREHRALSADAKDLAGQDLEVLDLYVTGAFEAGGAPVDLRIGNHVLNWGESTFIQNGVNVVNPFDVTKLRTPGAELRDALKPVPLVSASVEPLPALSVEGFYQLDWKKTEIDPVGTYFSTTDYVGAGAERAFFDDDRFAALLPDDRGGGFGPLTPAVNADLATMRGLIQAGLERANGLPAGALAGRVTVPADQPAHDPGFLSVMRAPDLEPRDSGQWGVAFRYLAERLNDTEFGFYFVNHHSRLPLVGAIYGTRAGYDHGLAAAAAVTAGSGTPLDPGDDSRTLRAITGAVAAAATPPVTQAVNEAFRQRITQGVVAAVPPGTPQPVIDGQVAARLEDPVIKRQITAEIQKQVQNQVASRAGEIGERLQGVASALAIDRYGRTARYRIEYPEDLRVFGVSFNTQLGASGWALQGEYSFHPDTPLQRTERSLFLEGLEPLTATLGQAALAGRAQQGQATAAEQAQLAALTGRLPGLLAKLGTPLPGYVERDVSQLQVTATKALGPVMASDGAVFIAEAAVMKVHDMPDQAATPIDSGGIGAELADATSFGYRAAARLDYNNAIGAARLSPYVQVQHDVHGSSPGPSGPFVEGRKALTLGVGAGYLERWQGNLGYTMYAGDKNLLSDRDFIAASVKYSF